MYVLVFIFFVSSILLSFIDGGHAIFQTYRWLAHSRFALVSFIVVASFVGLFSAFSYWPIASY